MMIHEASNGVHGNAEAHRKAAELLDGISNDIATIYANRTKATTEKIRELMKAETWMNAKESLAAGFIDEITNSSTEKNSIDFAAINTTSRDMKFLDRLTQPSDTEAQERIVALESTISQHDSIVQAYEDKLAIAETAIAEIETLKAENMALARNVESIATLESTIADLTAKVEITEEKISAAAAQKLAAQGHGEPLVIAGNVQERPANSMTITEFNALTPKARMAFIKAKGQLTD